MSKQGSRYKRQGMTRQQRQRQARADRVVLPAAVPAAEPESSLAPEPISQEQEQPERLETHSEPEPQAAGPDLGEYDFSE